MAKMKGPRTGWLRAMYAFTIAAAGIYGLAVLVFPGYCERNFESGPQDPVNYGILGAVFLAFGLLSVPGLREPVKFAPVLLLQLCYKSLWMIGVALPLWARGDFPAGALPFAALCAVAIIGDSIALPFRALFKKG